MTRTTRRPAFTLIELLVVISLMAVIAGTAVGVFGRIRGTQTRSANDATLTKINSMIDRRWNDVLKTIKDDIRNSHPGYAAVLAQVQNPDLAEAIWTHAKMKNELPMTAAEAKADVNVLGVYTLKAKAIFNALQSGSPQEESAACLYLAVNAGGTATDGEGLQQQVGATSNGAKCYKDVWGTPIAFVRMAYNAETNGVPFVPTGSTPTDPFDPRSKIAGWAGRDTFWQTVIRPPNTNWAGTTLQPTQNSYPGAVNFVPTAVSAGPNQEWGTNVFGLPPIPDTDLSKDNQISYRLRRQGGKGE